MWIGYYPGPESTQDQGKTSKYEKLHNLLGTIGIFFAGADIINGFVYLAEKDYVNAAISFACGIPAVGTVVTAVAKTAKLAKYATKAAKIAKTCRDIGRIGNAAAGMKALYDTYQTAERECETTGEKIAYIAGTVITGYLVGKAANKGAEALKKFASKAIPKLKTALKESAGKLVSKVSGAFSSFGNKGGSKTLFRGDKASVVPDDVFQNGFKPKGTHNDALLHTKSNTTAGNFISTSSDKVIATDFAGKNGYVYVIHTDNYVDINSTYGAEVYYPEQMEFSIPGGIKPSEVVGAYKKQGGKIIGDFIPNPNFGGN